jgi:chitodextrinase
MRTTTYTWMAVVAGALLTTACTLSDASAPLPTGPSELALSLAMSASPDIVTENGASQSLISIVARDSSGQPAGNVRLLVSASRSSGGIGSLSSTDVSTNTSGQASLLFTAPAASTPGCENPAPVVISAVPFGTDSASAVPRSVSVRLIPTAFTQISGGPVANFTFSPTSPSVNQLVLFNASSSFDTNGSITSYRWDWGDGEFVTKPVATEDHDYTAAGSYCVKLTVTDNSGIQTSTAKLLVVQ